MYSTQSEVAGRRTAHHSSRSSTPHLVPGGPCLRPARPASAPDLGATTACARVRGPSRLHPASAAAGAASSAGGTAAAAASTPAAARAQASAAPAAVRDDFAVDPRPIILFDGVCNLCNGGVNFMLDNDPQGIFRLAALQSPAGRRLLARCGRSPDDISSIVLVERNRHFIRSEAILRIGAALRLPLPLLATFGFPVPLPLRDAFYDAVASNRYSVFGRTDGCRLRDAGKFADRFVVD